MPISSSSGRRLAGSRVAPGELAGTLTRVADSAAIRSRYSLVSLHLHVHDVLVGADEAIAHLRQGPEEHRRLLHLHHHLRQLDARGAAGEGIGELSGALLALIDLIDSLAHQRRKITRLAALRRRRLRRGGAHLGREGADLGENSIDFHLAHGGLRQEAGTSMPASRSRASLYGRVRGLMPRRSAASRRHPWWVRNASRMRSRSACTSEPASERIASCWDESAARASPGGCSASLASSNWMCSGRITGPLTRMSARCSRLSSSRTFPGHS